MISQLSDYYFVTGDVSSIIIDSSIMPNRSGENKKLMYGQDMTFLLEASVEESYFEIHTEKQPVPEYYVNPSSRSTYQTRFDNSFDEAWYAYREIKQMYDGYPYRLKNTELFEGDIKYVEIPYSSQAYNATWAVYDHYSKQHNVLFALSDMASVEDDYRNDAPLSLSSVENLYADYRQLGKHRMNEMSLSVVYHGDNSSNYLVDRHWGVRYEQKYDERHEYYDKSVVDKGTSYRSFCVPTNRFVWMVDARGWNTTTGVEKHYLCFVPVDGLPLAPSVMREAGAKIESVMQSCTSPGTGTGGYTIELAHSNSGIAQLYESSRNTRWWN